MALVRVFQCDGKLKHDLLFPLRFTFRVYDDGFVAIQAITLRPDVSNPTRRHMGANPAVFAYDGQATRLPSDSDTLNGAGADASRVRFGCFFKLMLVWRSSLQVQLLMCQATLTSTEGLVGSFVVVSVDDGHLHAHETTLPSEFSLALRSYATETTTAVMVPLTPGRYELEGFTVAQNGHVHESRVVLQVNADGTLQGTCQDRLFPMEYRIDGEWSHTSGEVTYTLLYRVARLCSSYKYVMAPGTGGLRGRWTRQEGDTTESGSITHGNVRGLVELHLLHATRIWSPSFHLAYPERFQAATMQLLLTTLRFRSPRHQQQQQQQQYEGKATSLMALPNIVWLHVLSYCDFYHFSEQKKC